LLGESLQIIKAAFTDRPLYGENVGFGCGENENDSHEDGNHEDCLQEHEFLGLSLKRYAK
jgi:hypothetical protein